MRAVLLEGFGAEDVLRIGELPLPQPGREQVRIRVAAAGLNRADLLQREGHYPPPPGESGVLGLEVSGTIDALGDEASGWSRGDRVMTILAGGGCAEYVLAPAASLMRVPDGLDAVSAAALPEALSTVYLNLFEEGGLAQGERLLVHGGASGIGTTAIQLAKALAGAQVLVTVGSEEKAARCLELGADQAILYKQVDFCDRVIALTGGTGVDLILDHIGGRYLDGNMRSLAVGGRLVVIGLLGGARSELDLGRLLSRRLRVIGSVLRARPVAEKARLARALVERVLPLLASGGYRPVVDRVLPLEQVAEAHRAMGANLNVGKIVLTVSDGW
jgi:putative PIG3 family NAD(P)H quinone oxidoreductase